ncbi:hypothetical protein AAAV39_05030 [Phocaeicola massiliensis]|nr:MULTISPECIES: hypothetical protein [Bacteroides]
MKHFTCWSQMLAMCLGD